MSTHHQRRGRERTARRRTRLLLRGYLGTPNVEEVALVIRPEGMQLTKHHLFWPRRDYTTKLEHAFRELDINIVTLPWVVHEAIHRHQEPPKKPSVSLMQHVVDLYAPKRRRTG